MNQQPDLMDKFKQLEDKARKEYGYGPRQSFEALEKKTNPVKINAPSVPPSLLPGQN